MQKDNSSLEAVLARARLCERNGDYTRAERVYLKAIRALHAEKASDEPSLAIVMFDLAQLYETMGREELAETTCQEATRTVRNYALRWKEETVAHMAQLASTA